MSQVASPANVADVFSTLAGVGSELERSPLDETLSSALGRRIGTELSATEYIQSYKSRVYDSFKINHVKQQLGGAVDYSKISKKVAEFQNSLEELSRPISISEVPNDVSLLDYGVVNVQKNDLLDEEDEDDGLSAMFSDVRVMQNVKLYLKKVERLNLKVEPLSPPTSPLTFRRLVAVDKNADSKEHREAREPLPIPKQAKDSMKLPPKGSLKAGSKIPALKKMSVPPARATQMVKSLPPPPPKNSVTETRVAVKTTPKGTVSTSRPISESNEANFGSRGSKGVVSRGQTAPTVPLVFDATSQTNERQSGLESADPSPSTTPTTLVNRHTQSSPTVKTSLQLQPPVKRYVIPSRFSGLRDSVNDDLDEFDVNPFSSGVIQVDSVSIRAKGVEEEVQTTTPEAAQQPVVVSAIARDSATSPLVETRESAIETLPELIGKGTQTKLERTEGNVEPAITKSPVRENSSMTPWTRFSGQESGELVSAAFDVVNQLASETIFESYDLIIKCIEDALHELKLEESARKDERLQWEAKLAETRQLAAQERGGLVAEAEVQRTKLANLSKEVDNLRLDRQQNIYDLCALQFAEEESRRMLQQVVYHQLRDTVVEALFEFSETNKLPVLVHPVRDRPTVMERAIETDAVSLPLPVAEPKPSLSKKKRVKKTKSSLDSLPIDVVRVPLRSKPQGTKALPPGHQVSFDESTASNISALSTLLSEGEVLADIQSEGEIFVRRLDRDKLQAMLSQFEGAARLGQVNEVEDNPVLNAFERPQANKDPFQSSVAGPKADELLSHASFSSTKSSVTSISKGRVEFSQQEFAASGVTGTSSDLGRLHQETAPSPGVIQTTALEHDAHGETLSSDTSIASEVSVRVGSSMTGELIPDLKSTGGTFSGNVSVSSGADNVGGSPHSSVIAERSQVVSVTDRNAHRDEKTSASLNDSAGPKGTSQSDCFQPLSLALNPTAELANAANDLSERDEYTSDFSATVISNSKGSVDVTIDQSIETLSSISSKGLTVSLVSSSVSSKGSN